MESLYARDSTSRRPMDYHHSFDHSARHTAPVTQARGRAAESFTSLPTGVCDGRRPRGHPQPTLSTTTTPVEASRRSMTTEKSEWSPCVPNKPLNFSEATVENARYSPGGEPAADHTNEDRFFSIEQENSTVFACFDGHDGSRAVGYVSMLFMEMFKTESWRKLSTFYMDNIPEALTEFFKSAETDFFRSIEKYTEEKTSLQAAIPKGLRSYEAYQRYPAQVTRLQELEPKLSGGCTAVLAILCKSKLYVANVGDSRAVLVYEGNDKHKTLKLLQLSTDHGVENEEELLRLMELGLDPEQLKKNGRLGSQENTRSIGDYYIKEGYKDMDILSHAKSPPGSAEPSVAMAPATIDPSQYRYLILMSDGVYKSIQATVENPESIDPNKVLLNMILHNMEQEECRSFSRVADVVLQRLKKIHHDTYQKAARDDVRSPKAVNCRKRDDMTLLLYKFPISTAV